MKVSHEKHFALASNERSILFATLFEIYEPLFHVVKENLTVVAAAARELRISQMVKSARTKDAYQAGTAW